jgi:DNA-binding transcriptional regulator YiaG
MHFKCACHARLNAGIKPAAQGAVEAIPEDVRITAKSIKTLRLKLGLSQVEFGKLINVSSQNVFAMEQKAGRLKFRGDTLKNIQNIKGIGKKAAKKMLEEMEEKPKPFKDKTDPQVADKSKVNTSKIKG